MRQPLWITVENESLTETEKEELTIICIIKDNNPPECSEAYEYDEDGVEYVEVHINLLRGDGLNESFDTLREIRGNEGG